jgi:glycine oxidase
LSTHSDCLIVGGGVIGLSLAYELARHKLRVRVVDRQEPGREASWAGAGILPPASRAQAIHPLDQLRALASELHPAWAAQLFRETGIDNGYRLCGGLYLARSAGEAASLLGLARLLEEQEIACERLSSEALAEREPALAPLASSGSLRAVYLLPREGQLRNPRHLQALLAACRLRGVEITSGVEVEGFGLSSGRLAAVQTSQGSLSADRYCLTLGAWTARLLSQLGVPNGILPIRGQMVLFACERPPFTSVLNEGPRYLVPRDDGRVLVGSTEEEAGFDKSNTPEAVAELHDLACELVPKLRDAPVERTWAGLRPGTFDGFPYLGAIPGLSNAFVAAGHFRQGLYLSPATALVMSDLIRGQAPPIDLTPFRVGRG